MKVILFMAMSVNGYIAREDGGEDFISDNNWAEFKRFAKKYGNFVIGRKTYEVVGTWGEEYSLDELKFDKVILSQGKFEPRKGYFSVNSPQEAVALLSKRGHDVALLAGGSQTNASFAKEGLIDEVLINIEPYLIGKGISLFGGSDFENELSLIESRELSNDIIQLHYSVKK